MANRRPRRHRWWRQLTTALLAVAGTTVNAEQAERFDLPAQPLGESLQQVAKRFDLKIAFYNEFTDGLQAPPLRGSFTQSEAFDALLADTPLEYIFVVQTTVAVRPRAVVVAVPEGGPTMNKREPPATSENRRSRTGTARSLVAGLAAALLAGPAVGEDDEDDEGDNVETVIVTGTRMKLPPAQQVNNVITFNADDLQVMGVATIEEVFRRLPQNLLGATDTGGANSTTDFGGGRIGIEALNGTANVTGATTVNLRGIGERGTLILVDGKRIGESGLLGGFSDVSTIPLAMVERVDVLLDGASAIYGPDAVGGVVNVILRKDFEGVHVRIRHDASVEGGQNRQTASIAGTYSWERGSLTGAVNYFRTGALDASDSNAALAEAIGVYTPHGTVAGLGFETIEPISSLTEAARAAGVIGPDESAVEASVPAGGGAAFSVVDFLETVNEPILDPNPRTGDDLIPARSNYNVRFDLRQELPAGIGFDTAVQFAPRRTTTSRHNTYLNTAVPESNPYNPFGERVNLTKRLTEFPDLTTRASVNSWTLETSVFGEVPGEWRLGGWEWQVEGRYSRIETETSIRNEVRHQQIHALLLGRTLIDENGVYRNLGRYRDRSDGLFLNPFGPTLTDANPRTLIDEIVSPPQRNDTLTELSTLNAFVRGEVVELPAGKVQVVAGLERRDRLLDFQYRTAETRLTLVNNGAAISGFRNATNLDDQRAERTVDALYVELFVPIAADLPAMRKLSVTASGRRESVDGTGASPATNDEPAVENSGSFDYSTWQLGTSWEFLDGLRLHGSRHTSFITPSLLQLSIHSPSTRPYSIIESFWPSFRDASVSPPVNYAAEGIPLPWILHGSNPELKPERGRIRSAGLEWKPPFVNDLALEVGYSKSELFDRIAVRPEFGFAGFFGMTITRELADRFPTGLHRYDSGPYAGYIESVDARAINIGFQETSNLDYRVRYRLATDFGTFSLLANITKVIAWNRLDSQNDDVGQLQKFVGMWIPKYSQHVNLGWEYRGLRLNLDAHHREDTSYIGGPRTGDEEVVHNYPVNINLSGSYDFGRGRLFNAPEMLRGTVLRFGVNDLLDHRTKITFNGETDDEHSLTGRFLDVSNRSYYVEVAATVAGLLR